MPSRGALPVDITVVVLHHTTMVILWFLSIPFPLIENTFVC